MTVYASKSEVNPDHHFEADDLQWPMPWESVDLYWAKQALEKGRSDVLARYLREAPKPDDGILKIIIQLTRPKPRVRLPYQLRFEYRRRGRPPVKRPKGRNKTLLADLLDPPPEATWCLKFVQRRGNPGSSGTRWREHAIGQEIWCALLTERKLYLAAEEVMRRRGISRASAYRAWKEFPARKRRNS